MAEFGHRHSIQSRKSYSKARPNNVAPPNSASPFHYAAGCCRCSPFLPPLHAIQATLNQRFESACSRFVSPRFPKKGKTARKDRGDRIWPPRETSSSDYWLCKKKEAADILLFPSRFIFFVDGKDFLLVFHLPSIRSPREITPIISDSSTSSNREEEEGAKSCHKSNY